MRSSFRLPLEPTKRMAAGASRIPPESPSIHRRLTWLKKTRLRRMKISVWVTVVVLCLTHWCVRAETPCPRPNPGSTVEEPDDLRSQNGVLEARLTVHDAADANGAIRYCYTD